MSTIFANLFDSMSKVVFLLVAVASVVALFMGKITAEQFVPLVTMVFTFYFAAPTGSNSPSNIGGKK